MSVPGRNQPCNCGSELKYKHCHLISSRWTETQHTEHKVQMLVRLSNLYGGELVADEMRRLKEESDA